MLFNLETSAKLCAPVINVPMIRRFTDTAALCFVLKQSAFSFWGWNHTMIHNFPHRFSWSQVITWVVFHMVAWIQCWSLQLNAKRANSQIYATCFCFDFYSSSNLKWQLAWLIWWENCAIPGCYAVFSLHNKLHLRDASGHIRWAGSKSPHAFV